MIIQGEGEQNILNSGFNSEPSEVIVNGMSQPNCKKSCQFENSLNNVTIKFNTQIESCENMFNGLLSIIEIDLSKFDASNVISMYRMFSGCTTIL